MADMDQRSAGMLDAIVGKSGTTWSRSLRTLLSLSMVAMLIIVSLALVGLDYRRARNSAIDDTKVSMKVFADRLVDRFGVISGDTVTLVDLVSSVAN